MSGHWNRYKGNVKPKMRYQDKCWASSFQIISIRMTFHNVQGLGHSVLSDKIWGTHIMPIHERDFKSEHHVLCHHFAYICPQQRLGRNLERTWCALKFGGHAVRVEHFQTINRHVFRSTSSPPFPASFAFEESLSGSGTTFTDENIFHLLSVSPIFLGQVQSNPDEPASLN